MRPRGVKPRWPAIAGIVCIAGSVALGGDSFQVLFDAARIDFPAGGAATGIGAGDFDGDGDLDLAVGAGTSLVILQGRNEKVMYTNKIYALAAANAYLVTNDFNKDGLTDLALVGPAGAANGYLNIFLGNGDGTFLSNTNYAIESQGAQCVQAADFNGDNTQDLVVVSRYGDNYRVYLGNGDGTFAAQTAVTAGDQPSFVIAGEFDGDGMADIATIHFSTNNMLDIHFGNGDGTFVFASGAKLYYGVTEVVNPIGMTAGEFNGDNTQDLAVASLDGHVIALTNRGDGTFCQAWSNNVGYPVRGITAGDLNGDGIQDLAISAYTAGFVAMALGNGDGTFAAPTNYFTGFGNTYHVRGDFNNDGKVDIMTANGSDKTISPLFGNGQGQFNVFASHDNIVGGTLWHVAVADCNNDMRDDMLTANYSGASASYLMGLGNGAFCAATNYAMGSSPLWVLAADLNGDGTQDMATANGTATNISIRFGAGGGTFGARTNYLAGVSPKCIVAGYFDGDTAPDLAVANSGSGNIGIFINAGGGIFNPMVTYGTAQNPCGVLMEDFNGDGKADLATANNVDDNVSVLLGNGDGTFCAATNYAVGVGAQSIATADFNKDGKADLATVNYPVSFPASSSVSVLLGNGDGTFAPRADYSAGVNGNHIIADDFNGDGKPDLAVANRARNNSGGFVSILVGVGDGTFQPQVNYFAGTKIFQPQCGATAAGDFNLDGRRDLAMTAYGEQRVYCLLNNRPVPRYSGLLIIR